MRSRVRLKVLSVERWKMKFPLLEDILQSLEIAQDLDLMGATYSFIGRPSSIIVSEDGIRLGLKRISLEITGFSLQRVWDPICCLPKPFVGCEHGYGNRYIIGFSQSDALSDLGWRFVEYVFVRGWNWVWMVMK